MFVLPSLHKLRTLLRHLMTLENHCARRRANSEYGAPGDERPPDDRRQNRRTLQPLGGRPSTVFAAASRDARGTLRLRGSCFWAVEIASTAKRHLNLVRASLFRSTPSNFALQLLDSARPPPSNLTTFRSPLRDHPMSHQPSCATRTR